MVIVSPRGLEVSNVVLMGFKNSPAFAQRFMDRKLFDHRSFVRAYIDDIVVFSDSFEDHLKHLATVLQVFQDAQLALSPSKSVCAYQSIRLLGFKVDGLGLYITEDRMEAISKLAPPAKLSDLETYVGKVNFLRRFIPWFDHKIEPMNRRKTKLTGDAKAESKIPVKAAKRVRLAHASKIAYQPTRIEEEAFDILQSQIATGMKLYHHDPRRQAFLNIVASKKGFGVFMFHFAADWDGNHIPTNQIQPILFLSRKLTPTESRYTATELEVACLVWCCKLLRIRLQSSVFPIVVLTDHAATKGIVEQTNLKSTDLNKLNPKLTTASTLFGSFRFHVKHIPGRINMVPDALSRLPTADDGDSQKLMNVAKRKDEKKAERPDYGELDGIWDH